VYHIYTVYPEKVRHLMFDNNFGRRGPIFKIFPQVIRKKILHVLITKISTSLAICCYTTLSKSKIQKRYWFWQHLNRWLTCSSWRFWGH